MLRVFVASSSRAGSSEARAQTCNAVLIQLPLQCIMRDKAIATASRQAVVHQRLHKNAQVSVQLRSAHSWCAGCSSMTRNLHNTHTAFTSVSPVCSRPATAAGAAGACRVASMTSPPVSIHSSAAAAEAATASATSSAPVPQVVLSSSIWTRHLSPRWLPYAHLARLDKPIGTYLLLFPCLWSCALASPPALLYGTALAGTGATLLPSSLTLFALFSAGALIMRGAGCTVNDLLDRRFDARVARTALRPLASGALRPVHALVFLAAQLVAGWAVVMQLNPLTIALSCASLPLAAVYPLMKRVTHWPQLVLGCTFNWGAIVGATASLGPTSAVAAAAAAANSALAAAGTTSGAISAAAATAATAAAALYTQPVLWLPVILPLYVSGIAWTLVYDTIYAHQDTADDAKLGLRSTALYLGVQRTKPTLVAFSMVTVVGLAVAGAAAGAGPAFFALAVSGVGAHLAWQLRSVQLTDRASCSRTFVSNQWLGLLVLVAILLDKALAWRQECRERQCVQELLDAPNTAVATQIALRHAAAAAQPAIAASEEDWKMMSLWRFVHVYVLPALRSQPERLPVPPTSSASAATKDS